MTKTMRILKRSALFFYGGMILLREVSDERMYCFLQDFNPMPFSSGLCRQYWAFNYQSLSCSKRTLKRKVSMF